MADDDDYDQVDDLSGEIKTIRLKEGIDLRQLYSGEGSVFEVDTDMSTEGWIGTPSHNYYDDLELSKYAMVDDSSSDENEDGENNCDTPFEKRAKQMKPVTEDGGVLKRIVKDGFGSVVPKGAMVTVHYNGYLEFSMEPFDSTPLQGKKCQFRLGSGCVIPGLDIGISTMKKLEKSQFLIESSYAFGNMGCPPRIPPKTSVMFEVELLNFVDNLDVVEFDALSNEQQNEAGFQKLMKVCRVEHQAGNDYMTQNNMEKAKSKYRRALVLLEKTRLANEAEEIEHNKLRTNLLLNLALVYERLGQPGKVVPIVAQVREIDPNNIKALFRLGRALRIQGEFEQSRTFLFKAKRLQPSNLEITTELELLHKERQRYEMLEKMSCTKMFNAKGSNESAESSTSAVGKTPFVDVRTEFVNEVIARLDKFKVDDTTELTLPDSLSPSEILCVTAQAELLGLIIKKEKKNGNLVVTVCKS